MPFCLQWIELRCPRCKGELQAVEPKEQERRAIDGGLWSGAPPDDGSVLCLSCSHVYPVVCGIPDLRIFPDPYISFEGDRTKAKMLHSRFGDLDLAGIVALYYHITPETPPKDVESNTRRLLNAVPRAHATLEAWEESFGPFPRDGTRLLDVGCGTAPLLVAAQQRHAKVVGVDVGLRWLVVAKRRLLDLGVEIPLVAACAEALPFRAEAFDVVTMDSVLEIVNDQRSTLSEAHRALAASGRVLVATPNRFSVGPDPHLGLPGGGLLPRGVVNAIAKQRMARPPLRRLLGFAALGRMLRRAGFSETQVTIPAVSPGQAAQFGSLGRKMATVYNRARRLPLARQALYAVGPMLHACGRKA